MANPITQHIQDLHHASRIKNRWLTGNYNRATSPSSKLIIPNPDLFTALEVSRPDSFPTVAECAVHLELLEVFYTLRSNIISSAALDRTFGTEPVNRTVFRKVYKSSMRKYVREPTKLKDTTWDTRRKAKWSKYLDYAALRFVEWAKKTDELLSDSKSDKECALVHVPPLDILMVWHAFLLNPGSYSKYCKSNGLYYLVQVPFPWARIHRAIESNTWAFEPSESSKEWTQRQLKLGPDLYGYFVKLGQVGESTSTNESSLDHVVSLIMAENPILPIQPPKNQKNGPLIRNVERQAKFVDKMHAHLWICSPSTRGTITRAVERYENFVELFSLYPGKMLVPTLDVDIVWHTHQLSAAEYTKSMRSRCGRFIDHDDKIAQHSLDDGMAETKELYRVRFGGTYDVCLCWECEAMLDKLEACEDDELDGLTANDLAARVKKDVDYYKSVENMRRRAFR